LTHCLVIILKNFAIINIFMGFIFYRGTLNIFSKLSTHKFKVFISCKKFTSSRN